MTFFCIYCSPFTLLKCSILRNFVSQNTPRGLERNSISNDSKITYNSNHVKRWPESGPDSAKTPKISPELQEVTDSKNEQSATDSTGNHSNRFHQKCAICVHQSNGLKHGRNRSSMAGTTRPYQSSDYNPHRKTAFSLSHCPAAPRSGFVLRV